MAMYRANIKKWKLYISWHRGNVDSIELPEPTAFHTRAEALERLESLKTEKAKDGKVPWFASVMGPNGSEVLERNPVTIKAAS